MTATLQPLNNTLDSYARTLRSQSFESHFAAAIQAADRGDKAAALSHFAKAAESDPVKWGQIGAEALLQGRKQDALRIFTQTAQLTKDPKTRAACLSNIGSILCTIGNFSEAEHCFKQAVDLWQHHQFLVNYALTLKWRGDRDCFRWIHRAIQVEPSAEAILDRGLMRLLAGNLPDGFRDYESRFDLPNGTKKLPIVRPEWTGQDLRGKTLLLYFEQGVGDTVMMLRYAPLLKARGCRVILATQPKTKTLIDTLGFFDRVVEIRSDDEIPDCDYHLPMLSLPYRMGTTLETIPPPIPFTLGKRPRPSVRPQVGICWAGSFDHKQDIYRSTEIQQWPLAEWKVEVHNLQAGPRTFDCDLEPFQPADYLDTANAIAQMDLVITVDTSIAHIAGSMGIPTWVLIPFAPDWRWLDPRLFDVDRARFHASSPWYPSLVLFRQPKLNDWASVFSSITDALTRLQP